jgi:hypothetical protein
MSDYCHARGLNKLLRHLARKIVVTSRLEPDLEFYWWWLNTEFFLEFPPQWACQLILIDLQRSKYATAFGAPAVCAVW